jgi:hypothetical protein
MQDRFFPASPGHGELETTSCRVLELEPGMPKKALPRVHEPDVDKYRETCQQCQDVEWTSYQVILQ